MSILTKTAIGIVAAGLLTMYGFYLYMWLPNDAGAVVAHHAAVLFLLSVVYLIGLGIYKAWKAVIR